jgi:hypothetical protein
MTTISNKCVIERSRFDTYKVWTLRYGDKTYRVAFNLRALADRAYRPHAANYLHEARRRMRGAAA